MGLIKPTLEKKDQISNIRISPYTDILVISCKKSANYTLFKAILLTYIYYWLIFLNGSSQWMWAQHHDGCMTVLLEGHPLLKRTTTTTILLPLDTLCLCLFEIDHLMGDEIVFSILGFQFGSQFCCCLRFGSVRRSD